MKKNLIVCCFTCAMLTDVSAQNVGIGTNTPKAAFNVAEQKIVLFGADVNGKGNKLIWYPLQGALRAGYAGSNEFDWANIGLNSISLGYGNIASGNYTTAIGALNKASGDYSTALGYLSTAIGLKSTSIGSGCVSGGNYSYSFGYNSKANGNFSTAIGINATSYGEGATALGNNVVATGDYSTAMGINSNTGNHTNSFCIGGSPTQTANSVDNQMMMRFDNYTFWVSASNYAYLVPASNGWAYTSDRNKKERFLELNGETVLNKIATIPFYSWNFKANDTKQYRHYGVMAQDFYNAFGKDDFGVIGNDTTVSPLDMLGVAYSAIKELEKRTGLLQNDNKRLADEVNSLKGMLAEMDKLKLSLEAIKQKIR